MMPDIYDRFEFLLLGVELVFRAVDLEKPSIDVTCVAVAGIFSRRDACLRLLGIKGRGKCPGRA